MNALERFFEMRGQRTETRASQQRHETWARPGRRCRKEIENPACFHVSTGAYCPDESGLSLLLSLPLSFCFACMVIRLLGSFFCLEQMVSHTSIKSSNSSNSTPTEIIFVDPSGPMTRYAEEN